MGMIDKLRAIGIAPCTADLTVNFQLHEPEASTPSQRFSARSDSANPLVSCLMVTRGNLDILRHSIECYASQSWANRELIVITDADKAAGVEDLIRARGIDRAVLVGVGPGLSLGDLRNMSVARARGDILVQWDDDDLSDPHRIATATAVLLESKAAAAFMSRWVMWWPQRHLAAISYRRLWEGSMAVWRERAPVYPAWTRGEDAAALGHLRETCAVIDSPLQYVYTITGQNTWDTAHFEAHLALCEHVFEGEDYRALRDLLAERLPIAAYEADLRRIWAQG